MSSSFFKTVLSSSVSGYALLAVLAVSALLWPSGQAQASDLSPAQPKHVVKFTASIDASTSALDDVKITGLTLPAGVTISPAFQSDTQSYTLTVPATIGRLGFTGRFTSPPYNPSRGRSGFGVAVVGTPTQIEPESDNPISSYLVATDGHPSLRTNTFVLEPGNSTTTIVMRVYKRLPGRERIPPMHDSENSVWKTIR